MQGKERTFRSSATWTMALALVVIFPLGLTAQASSTETDVENRNFGHRPPESVTTIVVPSTVTPVDVTRADSRRLGGEGITSRSAQGVVTRNPQSLTSPAPDIVFDSIDWDLNELLNGQGSIPPDAHAAVVRARS